MAKTAARKTPHEQTCERCPNRYSARGCPAWIGEQAGLWETDIASGAERLITGCYFQVSLIVMKHVIAASNRPSAAFESFREETAKMARDEIAALDRVRQAMAHMTTVGSAIAAGHAAALQHQPQRDNNMDGEDPDTP